MKKKILLLGGSAQQIIAIETAKRLGYYTVLCDYLTDNPGQYHADKFYLVSTTDREAVLDVARKEQVHGILAYASDPAAPSAAYAAEKLGLPTNPFESVDILCNKDKFRSFLLQNGFNCPRSKGYANADDAVCEKDTFEYPVIIKPVDSSGSKGVTILDSPDGFEKAVDFAFSYSRGGRIIIEQFIVHKYDFLIGGDIFVNNGDVIIWGLMNCFRRHSANPLVPGGKIFPALLSEADDAAVKRTLRDMVTKLGINFGAMNVELLIDKSGKVFPIDIGPRAGGNMIPIQLSEIYGVDIVEMSVLAAMGEDVNSVPEIRIPYCASYVLHSDKQGVFREIQFDDEIRSHIFRKEIYKKDGDAVECFDNASAALGIIFMKADSIEQLMEIMNDAQKHIHVVLE